MEKGLIKPRLESNVWVLYGNRSVGYCVNKVKVVAIGKEFFVHNEVFDDCKVDDYRVPTYYKDYKSVWFKSLKEVRELYKIKKVDDKMYEITDRF